MKKILISFLILATITSPSFCQDLSKVWEDGPFKATLGESIGEVQVPEGHRFTDGEGTRAVMKALGNLPSHMEKGLIIPNREENVWLMIFEYDPLGYVKDNEKGSIDADAILSSMKEGTDYANEYRKEQGLAPLYVTGWHTKPYYDEETHNLTWAIRCESEGRESINYNTKYLGRGGIMSVTIVSDEANLNQNLTETKELLQSFTFVDGKKYGEWVEGDKLADIGLTALIVGGAGFAAAKLGIFALLWKFMAKAWYLVIAALGAMGSFLKKTFLGGKGKEEHTS